MEFWSWASRLKKVLKKKKDVVSVTTSLIKGVFHRAYSITGECYSKITETLQVVNVRHLYTHELKAKSDAAFRNKAFNPFRL